MITSDRVLAIFREITTIPRESGHEEHIIEYLLQFAKKHNLNCKSDQAGNVLITKEASHGKESSPTIILQSHSDMVCEKNSGIDFDFSKDPIKVEEENGWLIAKETTLGADCGIGIAAQLAILESNDLQHGKIECLFTTSEETGLDGAKALKPGFFTGKILINLDSEDEGELFIGCAGGIDTTAKFRYTPVPTDPNTLFSNFYKVGFHGAIGGHSGDDIDKGRANAVQLLARYLYNAFSLSYDLHLCHIDGGNKRNAIAREAYAIINFPQSLKNELEELFNTTLSEIQAEYSVTDPDISGTFTPAEAASEAVDNITSRALVASLNCAPHGVLAMSPQIKGLVETSSNLASVKMETENIIRIGSSQRSSINSSRKYAAERVESAFAVAGAEVSHESEYPGWRPNLDSQLLKVSEKTYKELFGATPIVRAIHAGLECGLFLETFPDLDMISFGPTLRGVHAPGERLEIASVDKFIKLLETILTKC